LCLIIDGRVRIVSVMRKVTVIRDVKVMRTLNVTHEMMQAKSRARHEHSGGCQTTQPVTFLFLWSF